MRDRLNRIGIRSGVERAEHDAAQPVTWPWAAASIALVALVAIGMLLARTLLLASARPTVVPAPPLPAMNAVAVAHPEAGALLYALDADAGHLVALAAPGEQMCSPIGPCQPAPAPDNFVVLDGQSGNVLATTPLTGDASAATGASALLADSARHLAYAVSPQSVTIFSTESGAHQGGYSLPSDLSPRVAAALVGDSLYLTNGAQLVLLSATSGRTLAQADLPGGNTSGPLDGPIVDGVRGSIYLAYAATAQDPPTLVALDAHDLHLLGRYTLPASTRLGPMDAAGADLYVFGPDGTTSRLPLDALAANADGLAPLAADATLRNALTLGENPSLGHLYMADASHTRILSSGNALASLPLPADGPPSSPLLVDAGRNLVYLPADHGALVIVRDNASVPKKPLTLTPETALIIARAAFAATWHDGEPAGGPAFASAAMFPVLPGTRAQQFWVSDPSGWHGPYLGQLSTAIAPVPHAADQRVTFTLSWNQLFPHTHTWSWDIPPSGASVLVADSGDAVP